MSKSQRARILVFGNQKGGVGKTTLSISIASCWALSGKSILFVDADPQRSASEQLRDHPNIEFVSHTEGDIHTILPKLVTKYDYVIVDTPSGVNAAFNSAIRVADMVVIPVKPSPFDLLSSNVTVKMARENKIKTTLFIVNESDSRVRFTRESREALQRGYKDARVAKQLIASRTAHRESVSYAKTVLQLNLNGGKAAAEITALAREVAGILEE